VHALHVLYPSPARLRAATRFLQRRAGRKSFAVIDDAGRLHGYRVHSRFHSASVVKSMLVAYLRKLARALTRRGVVRVARGGSLGCSHV
jgi:hypothetical protein